MTDIDDGDDVSRPLAPCRTCGGAVHPDTAWGDCEQCTGLPGECPTYCSEACYHTPEERLS